uniref:F-box domain-containing protein n=1 Tax=Strigamia maritima TaxID=126957 RepID=T1IRZ9_STRMM
MCYFLDESLFEDISLNYLAMQIETKVDVEFAVTLLQQNKVRYLRVSLASNHLDISDLFNAISKSNNLYSFSFDSLVANRDTVIDLSVLTNGGSKKFEYLKLKDCIVCCKQPLTDRNCIHILSINGVSKETFFQIEPTNLRCRITDVNELLEMNCANSIKCINIHVTRECNILDQRMLNFLSTCKHLQTLHISSVFNIDAQTLVKGLKQLGIKKFVYSFENFNEVDLFQFMNDNWTTQNSSETLLGNKLESIHIIYERNLYEKTGYLPCILNLLKGLQCHHWKRVNFVTFDTISYLILRRDLHKIDTTIFSIVLYPYGSDNDDPEYYKFLSELDFDTCTKAIAVTIK